MERTGERDWGDPVSSLTVTFHCVHPKPLQAAVKPCPDTCGIKRDPLGSLGTFLPHLQSHSPCVTPPIVLTV